MVGNTLDIKAIIKPDRMASEISMTFQSWNTFRQSWLAGIRELRNYIFATDTRTTSNSSLPWKNNTTIPKICQIRDNLHANYNAALFPNADWMKWEGSNEEAEEVNKRLAIQGYMDNKVKQSGFQDEVSKLLYDWIDTGNVFVTTEWVEERTTDPTTGEEIAGYVGPKAVRISPYDIVFNPTATSFDKSPKIIRTIKSVGEVMSEFANQPTQEAKKIADYALARAKDTRRSFGDVSDADLAKAEAYMIDGFGDLKSYYGSGLVEILQFHGTLFDLEAEKLYEDHIITVIDRAYIVKLEPNPSWRKNSGIRHCGWRLRPDNLYAQGPLENIVGMQYRIDHLENLKADVFDLVAFPCFKIRGYVEDFNYGPNQRIYVGDEGDVDFMHPDVTALSANTDIERLEMKMEEMVGAPRQAMGIRTPGEKTAFEVSSLDNAANRIFDDKVRYFERVIVDGLLNDMLELGRRMLPASDLVRVLDKDTLVADFLTVTKEDLVSSGRITPIGAAHFAKRNQLVQNLTNLFNSRLGSDPSVINHFSGKGLAFLMEDLLDIQKYGLVSDNVRIMETMDSTKLAQAAQQSVELNAATPVGEV